MYHNIDSQFDSKMYYLEHNSSNFHFGSLVPWPTRCFWLHKRKSWAGPGNKATISVHVCLEDKHKHRSFKPVARWSPLHDRYSCDNWNELSHLACAAAPTRSVVAPRIYASMKMWLGFLFTTTTKVALLNEIQLNIVSKHCL